jgi:hypothetical protein
MNDERITYFAETDARNERVKFGIKGKDRTRHVYVIGKTGMGKSTLLENMAVQDIQNGDGMCFIDPHGKTADLIMEYVPKERIKDVIWIAPFDTEYPISFNVLESVDPTKRHLVVSGLMSTFKKIWVDAWSARMEYILTNTLLALLEYPGATLLGVNRMLSDKSYRNDVISHITDPSVKTFWVKEWAGYTERMAAEAVPAIQNKVGQFTANPLIRNMIGQPHSSFDFREAMDRRKIVVINLSKGKIGDENMKLLGGLLVTKIYLASMSRADVPDRTLKMMPNFYLFVDEFQNFANASFADILSESRKYKLNLTIAHQYIEQMDEEVRAAVFGNVGTMITFRVGATDAEMLEKEYAPQFTIEDLVNLGFAQIYLKLMINGLTSAPFSAVTMKPIPHPEHSYINEIIAASREQYARPRAEVEEGIIKFHEQGGTPRAAAAKAPAASSAPSAITTAPTPVSTQTPAPKNLPGSAPIRQPASEAKMTPSVASTHGKAAPHMAPAPEPQIILPPTVPRPDLQIKPTFSPGNEPKAAPAVAAASAPKPAPKQDRPTPPPLEGGSSSLKEALAQAMKAKPVPPAPSVPAPAPTAKPAESQPQPSAAIQQPPTPKPVSLSSLAPKPPQQNALRPDPKAQTPENVANLKNALASVLGDKLKKPQPETQPQLQSQPASPAPKAAPAQQKPAPSQPKPQPTQPAAQAEPAKEVPEDVLKRVLKLE